MRKFLSSTAGITLVANWGRYFDRLQNPQVQMPKIDNRRQAESHPSLLEDGRGVTEVDKVKLKRNK